MIKEALQYIVGLGNTRTEKINDRTYSTQPMSAIKDPSVAPITINSLSGLVDYIQSEFDGPTQFLLQISSPTQVNLFSHLDAWLDRQTFIQGTALLPQFTFGRFYDVESFNIALQSVFVPNQDRSTILKIVGNLKDENVTSFGDDGVSQQVTAKMGVATVANVKVPNPVNLKPFRTFVEIEQPESQFVFRMRKGMDGPECALFEADGGWWKHEALERIEKYLHETIGGKAHDRVTILA